MGSHHGECKVKHNQDQKIRVEEDLLLEAGKESMGVFSKAMSSLPVSLVTINQNGKLRKGSFEEGFKLY
jgi:hypothetical protein